MAKYFAKLNSEVETISLSNGENISAYKVTDIKLAHDTDTSESVKLFHSNDADYVEYFMEVENNPKQRSAFVGGYYISSVDKFTDTKILNSWVVSNIDYLYEAPSPWPRLDDDFVAIHEEGNWVLSWDEENIRLTRLKTDENDLVIDPKITQLYDPVTKEWSDL
tara:strand:- start:197 stop:688 length:492 start_codon:yes stop_codon:yes gene_type:complete